MRTASSGAESDTGDIWGNVTFKEKTEVIVTGEAVRDAVRSVKGTQSAAAAHRIPPSARTEKELYEYAREGIAVEVEPREITVFEAETVAVFHEPHRVLFDIACSKGTYIRTICEDIGRKLGCGAVSDISRADGERILFSGGSCHAGGNRVPDAQKVKI